MFLNIVCLGISLGIVPLLLGMLYLERKTKNVKQSLISCYVKGMFTMWGIFQIVAVPMIFLKASLTRLVLVYGGVLVFLCIISMVLHLPQLIIMIRKALGETITIPWQIWVAVIVIVLQTYMLSVNMHIDDDDAFYVASAVTSVETDTIFSINPYTGRAYKELPSRYVLSPFYAFCAVISSIANIHPTILCHVYLPLVLIPFCYCIYGLIAKRLFPNNKKAVGYFLLFAALIQMFSAYSAYTQGVFMLTRIWQGKAVLTSALLPCIFYLGLEIFENGKKGWISLLMLMFAACMVSSMGIFLSGMTLGILAFVSSLKAKGWKILFFSFLCCLPNLAYAGMYILIR